MKNTFNKEKFKEVLHYIVFKVGALENFGKTVLYKILYFSDFDYYELRERFITGEKYFKLTNGPAPSDFDLVISELINEYKIKSINTTYKKFSQIKFISLYHPKLYLLSADEIQLIDKVINKLSNMNATQISSYSHEDMPWKATENNKEIDYELVFYRSPIFSVIEDDE